jgi:dTDP-4-amino-4,6-dideoxygalactose transaminase
MVDLKTQYHALRPAIDERLAEALANTQFILGPNVKAFEQEAASYLGVSHAVSCGSGTDALMLALMAAAIGPGDEVITTPFSFIATAEAARLVGAEPVFVDIDPGTFNIDPEQIEGAITPRTRAVIPVHLFGQPAALDALTAVCEAHGLWLIEDAAQSFGARFHGRQTGTFGAMGCFSFFPSKNLGAYGDGGMVTTDSEPLAERLRMLRNHGSAKRYHHDRVGVNSRLDELQAVILRAKLPHIESYNRERRRVAAQYEERLSASPAREAVCLPRPADTAREHVYHQYTIQTAHRDHLAEALRDRGVATAIYYPIPLHRQTVFAEHAGTVSLPVAEAVATRCLSLPIYPELTASQIERVASAVQDVLRGH